MRDEDADAMGMLTAAEEPGLWELILACHLRAQGRHNKEPNKPLVNVVRSV